MTTLPAPGLATTASAPPPRAMRAVAAAFAEEYARVGYGADRIVRLFDDPRHVAAHVALLVLGEPAIRAIVENAVAQWPLSRVLDALAGGHD